MKIFVSFCFISMLSISSMANNVVNIEYRSGQENGQNNDTTVISTPDTIIIKKGTQEQPPAPPPDTVYDNRGEGSGPSYGNPDTIGGLSPRQATVLQRRRETYTYNIAGFGPAWFNNLGSKELSYNFYAGRMWEVNPFAAIKALGEVATDFKKVIMGEFNIGANLYAFNNDISPYIGADLGFGVAHGTNENIYGFDGGGAVGLQFFRTSSAQMTIEGKVHTIFNTSNKLFPVYYAVRLGLLF